jgi:hypothetical protein
VKVNIALVAILVAVTASAAVRHAGPPVLLKASDLPVAVEAEALQRQFDALSAMPEVEVKYSSLGPVQSISGNTGVVFPDSLRGLEPGAPAGMVLDAFGAALLATGSETLTVSQNGLSLPRERDIRFEQSIRGIPVIRSLVAISLDEETGRVRRIVASFLPDRGLPKKAGLSAAQAWLALVRALEASGDAVPGSVSQIEKPRLAYFGIHPDTKGPQLVWEIRADFTCPTGRHDSELVWIDAIDGSVAGRHSTNLYFVSPGPCQQEELAQADCGAELDPFLGNAGHGASCAGDATKPLLVVTRLGCSNSFRLSWPRIAGAAQYHVIRAPVDLGWAFARTVGAGYVHQCTTRVDAPNLVKMRACDGCGCGEWSEVQVMDPRGDCP